MNVAEPTLRRLTNEIWADAGLLAQIIDVSGDAIFSEDLTGVIQSWNEAAERLYGSPASDMLGTSAADLLTEESATQLGVVRDLALSGERVERFDSWHQRSDGRPVAVSMTVSPLRGPDGRIVGLATSTKDVAERFGLPAELEEVNRALEMQYIALSTSNRDLEQFAYVASHDLSEPLRVISGFVQLLERCYVDLLDDRGRGYMAQVVDGAERMRALIEDLLESSRYMNPASPSGSVDVSALTLRVAASLEVPDVVVAAIPRVWCSEASLSAVMQNLISNALKFHEAGVVPLIQVSGSESDGQVQINVDDNGIGIAQEYRERVFEMFRRLHVREAFPGTGIGLAIVRQIAESSGGHAWVEESALGGCRLCVTFPAASAHTMVSA